MLRLTSSLLGVALGSPHNPASVTSEAHCPWGWRVVILGLVIGSTSNPKDEGVVVEIGGSVLLTQVKVSV